MAIRGASAAEAAFDSPQPVRILGYAGDAMEPFISRDGRVLFFNSSNAPGNDTNLFWASRLDDLTFQFNGPIRGVNTPALEAVASMDRHGEFYFISNRSYDTTLSTIYRGRFANGAVSQVGLAGGMAALHRGLVIFDAEIDAAGDTLYFVEGDFTRQPAPASAQILIARKRPGGGFARDPKGPEIMQNVNSATLSYAPDISADGREFFFTRLDPSGPAIYTATRPNAEAPFGPPRKIEAIDGFVEAPSISPDGHGLYYHRRDEARFGIHRTVRRVVPQNGR